MYLSVYIFCMLYLIRNWPFMIESKSELNNIVPILARKILIIIDIAHLMYKKIFCCTLLFSLRINYIQFESKLHNVTLLSSLFFSSIVCII